MFAMDIFGGSMSGGTVAQAADKIPANRMGAQVDVLADEGLFILAAFQAGCRRRSYLLPQYRGQGILDRLPSHLPGKIREKTRKLVYHSRLHSQALKGGL